MKILVTGHKGFIGSRLFHDLRYEQGYGYGVEGLDSPDDIGDWVAPSGMFAEHYDCIIHLAAFAALRDSIENPEKFWHCVSFHGVIHDFVRAFDFGFHLLLVFLIEQYKLSSS